MKNEKPPAALADDLRRRAETRLRRQSNLRRTRAGAPPTEGDTQRLLHELQVHQVELEMQNEDLKEARNRTEILLEKYTDLYDFAPVGYFSLDAKGGILEVNLAGAAMLGVERSLLVNQPLQRFMLPASRPTYLTFLARIFTRSGKQVCEAALMHADATPFWASLHGTSAVALNAPRDWCRVSVANITSLKQAEEAQRRIEVLDAANRELALEIIRRRAVEKSLKKTQQQHHELLEQARLMHKHALLLTHRVLTVQEDERKQISRDLHDVIAQMLTAIGVRLATLDRSNGSGGKGLRAQIAYTQRLVNKSVAVLHRFALQLRPPVLDDLGLTPALHALLKVFAKQSGLQVALQASARVESLDEAKRAALYRIAQEAISNIARHAQASRVEVRLKADRDAVCMRITDDGKAFDVARELGASKRRHLGLVGMRERAEIVGGRFTVQSTPGAGTTIEVRIPIPHGKPARGAKTRAPIRRKRIAK